MTEASACIEEKSLRKAFDCAACEANRVIRVGFEFHMLMLHAFSK